MSRFTMLCNRPWNKLLEVNFLKVNYPFSHWLSLRPQDSKPLVIHWALILSLNNLQSSNCVTILFKWMCLILSRVLVNKLIDWASNTSWVWMYFFIFFYKLNNRKWTTLSPFFLYLLNREKFFNLPKPEPTANGWKGGKKTLGQRSPW